MSNAAPGDLPGSADAARIQRDREPVQPPKSAGVSIPDEMPQEGIPANAKSVKLVLKKVEFEGVTAFKNSELEDLYSEYLGKEITLDVVYTIANKLTARYHDNGYFLSRAFVPPQEISSGNVKIKVIEGYVGEVKIQGEVYRRQTIQNVADSITAEKPVKIDTIENRLLLLNDLPGTSFRAVIEPVSENYTGAVRLVLIPQEKDAEFNISYDNYGSRYLGPFQAIASYQGSIIPMQKTSLSTVVSTPADELKYFSASHEIPITSRLFIEGFGNYADAEPGYKLQASEIESDSVNLGLALKYQLIRQRDENLGVKFLVEGRNSNSDILGTPLTRDRIRAARLSATYDVTDNWQGYNFSNITFSHGLEIFGANNPGDLNLSRGEARPDFKKAEFSLSRLQGITSDWAALFSVAGQYSDEPLYSSEEFGYGGQAFGRAFDSSEITGDSGLAGGLELRYYGISLSEDITTMPYVFYDIGKVWNQDSGPNTNMSASSTGLGIRFASTLGLAANLTVAQPLTKEADAPQNGGKNPRYLFSISYSF